MDLNKKEIEVVEELTGSHEIDYDFAVQIAKLTYGDKQEAQNAAILFKMGWSKQEVLASLGKR